MSSKRPWSGRRVATLYTTICLGACTQTEPDRVEHTDPHPGRAPDLSVDVSALYTSNAGNAYRSECENAGVPPPERVLSSEWVNHGLIVDPFLAGDLDAELWS